MAEMLKMVPLVRMGTPASGSSSRRKVQTSYFTKLFAKFNTRFHQLPAPHLLRKSASNLKTTIKKASIRRLF